MVEKTYKVGAVKGQLKITLPKSLAVALNIDKGDKMMWKIDRGELVLRKAK